MIVRAVALMLASLPGPAQSQAFPPFTGYVVDQADLLPADQEGALAKALGVAERVTRHQFAIATVRSLGGTPIERYATMLGNHWGVGRRGMNDGVLLVVAPTERRVRIAVGKGLRSVLTDAEAAAIIEHRILPRFRSGHLAAGIMSGSAGILRELAPRRV